jgi:5-methylcytosine-specific restriction endonuclease McrA
MKTKSKKSREKELDDMWKYKVKKRDNFTCQVCRKKLTSKTSRAHHILPRQMKKLRWDVNNGITLCDYHHRRGIYSPHQNAIWWFGWMNQNRKAQLKYCINKLVEIGKKYEL